MHFRSVAIQLVFAEVGLNPKVYYASIMLGISRSGPVLARFHFINVYFHLHYFLFSLI